jgi:hypothetical protein
MRQQGIAQARLNDAIDALPQAAAPALEESVSGPRLGANGVIDARTDSAALDAAAKAYQAAHPGTDYLSAVKAVQSPNGGN